MFKELKYYSFKQLNDVLLLHKYEIMLKFDLKLAFVRL